MKRLGKHPFLLTGAVAVTVVAFLLLPSRPSALRLRPSYDKIQGEMTQEEVLRIVSVPAGDYSTGPIDLPSCGNGLPKEVYRTASEGHWEEWKADDGILVLLFDGEGRVIAKYFTWAFKREPVVDRLRRLLGL
jgi:hypothetical protein